MARPYSNRLLPVGKQIKKLNENHPHMQKSETRHPRLIKVKAVGDQPAMIYDSARHPHMAHVLAKEYGFTSKQMAEVFGVSVKTVDSWNLKHPEFKKAVQEGRDAFDSVHVENALLKIALGYEYQEKSIKTVSVRGVDAEGKGIRIPAKETTVTTKILPPNVKAIGLWLTNRNPERWKMVSTVNANISAKTEHTENIVNVSADLSKMDSTQLRALRELITTQKIETIETTATEDVPMLQLIDRAKAVLDAEDAQLTETE